MNKNLQSPTKLTEFAPLQPDEKHQGVGQFISKFFKLNRTEQSEQSSTNVHERPPEDASQEGLPPWAVDVMSDTSQDPGQTVYHQVDVLKRIRNLLANKSNNLQSYSETELKQYWMPDSVSKECYECSEKFTTFRRRHHCRVCGQIFCSQCCYQQIPGKIFGCTGDLRVCTYCCKIVLSYLQSPDVEADLTADLKALQESLQNKYGISSPTNPLSQTSLSPNQASSDSIESGGTLRRKISVGYQEEKFALDRTSITSYLTSEEKCKVLQNSASLRNLYDEICKPTTGITLQTHRYRLRIYAGCFWGSELVDWLIYQQKANNRIQAAALAQALLEGGYIESVSEILSFIDGYALYKPGSNVLSPDTISSFQKLEVLHPDEPSWIQHIPHESSTTDSEAEQLSTSIRLLGSMAASSSYMLDLNIEANSVYLSRPPPSFQDVSTPGTSDIDLEKQMAYEEATVIKTSEQKESAPESGWHHATHLREENGEKAAYNLLTEAFKQHEQNLLKQLLCANELPLNWNKILVPLIHEIVDIIRPDKNHDAEELNIRKYVQFKKVLGEMRDASRLINGIVCTKNVAHREMPTDLDNPNILLLDCSIVYQRTEGRLMSLEPILMQEAEYLKHIIARIVALQPNIVLVRRNVSRLAQDLLRQQGITLILNVKQSILERLARCTQADLVTSMDAQIGRPRLGSCKRFYLKTFNEQNCHSKTLMVFEGVPLPHLGATVLLRGNCKTELIKLKAVASLHLFAYYNWRLEKAFLMDEFAQPPNRKDEFFDESKENSPDLPNSTKKLVEINNQKSEESTNNIGPKGTFFDADTEFFVKIQSEQTKVNEVATKKNSTDEKNMKSVKDFSDPLHSGITEAEVFKENSSEKLSVAELPFSSNFRKALDGTILCLSPYLIFSVPYLETEIGKRCKLRGYFPREIYYSKQFENIKKKKPTKEIEKVDTFGSKNGILMKPAHPFITARISSSANCPEIQTLLANFRACGGRLEYKQALEINTPDDCKKEIMNADENKNMLDVLDVNNHQKLAVLFCSFSYASSNAPAFCVSPWVVHMEFYGCNDIPLGCFLEKYCFRSTYSCPSTTCDTPMIKHTRRFAHNGGCVTLTLNGLESEFQEDQIVMWSWCSKCQRVSPVVPMSRDTWSFSFVKYLELRFHGSVYSRRGTTGCPHSLHHDHYQYFGYKSVVASFIYTTVQLWEISLPPPLINTVYNTNIQQTDMTDEVRTLALKGYEIYSIVSEKLLNITADIEVMSNLKQILSKEQAIFKQKIEEVQLKLTSPTVECKNTNFDDPKREVQAAMWKIADALVRMKRIISDAVEQWNQRFTELVKKKDSDKKKDKPFNDLEGDGADIDRKSNEIMNSSGAVAKKIRSLDQDDVDEEMASGLKGHQRSQSDGTVMSQNDESDCKKENDKKTVKNILSQLLPSSITFTLIPCPFSQQEHYMLSSGLFIPIVVYESEPSSIIAYALNSNDYKSALDEISIRRNQSTEHSPSLLPKKRTQSDKERTESGEFLSSEKSTGLLSFLRTKESKSDSTSTASPSISDANQLEEPVNTEKIDDSKKGKAQHIEIQFNDNSCNFFCRIYCAEKFATLRNLILPDGEDAYIRSLSRCVQWNARGGKSGSTFCKTRDDRFVLKEMPKSEIQLFLESASEYFNYMQHCLVTHQPTLLGKIVGIYQIIFRNSSTNAVLRTNLLVMENLFYNRTVTHKFDLKGSMRNRLVNTDNQDGEIVLLDENLLKMTCESPLYILPHSQTVLTAAIQHDTKFLSHQSVMDYSLLVGLDSDNKELVLGIIDYIRTFTWDKKLETMVKKTGILGGQGKLPTIISPEEYRKRFIEAMHRYFLEVPDHWAGLGKGIET